MNSQSELKGHPPSVLFQVNMLQGIIYKRRHANLAFFEPLLLCHASMRYVFVSQNSFFCVTPFLNVLLNGYPIF